MVVSNVQCVTKKIKFFVWNFNLEVYLGSVTPKDNVTFFAGNVSCFKGIYTLVYLN